MPIRFRCPHCTRLLGIARRKAGAQILCPECRFPVTVPTDVTGGQNPNDPSDPHPLSNGSAPPGIEPEPSRPVVAAARPKRKPDTERPLFENDDFDKLLGMPSRPAPDAAAKPEAKPVSGMDVLSLDDDSKGKGLLTGQNVLLIGVGVALLLGGAFAAGFVIARGW